MENKKFNVLMIGPARKVKGGMTTVVDNLYECGLNEMVNLEYLETINDSNKISKYIKEKIGFIKFKMIISKYDIVHIHMASNRSTYRKIKYIDLAYRSNKKIVLHIHGGGFADFYDNLSNNKKNYIKNMLNKADKVIVLSEEWKKYFSKIIYDSKIIIVYNGVRIHKNNFTFAFNHNILFLGRICEEKGIYNLLKAISIVKNYYPDVKLIICGSGEESQIEYHIKKLNINSNVEFKGWIGKEEKDDYIKKCSILVLPSKFEAMPMSILEAMSFNKVVIATNVGGIPQIINHRENGYLIDDNNYKTISDSIIDIYENEKLRNHIVSNSSKIVEERFDIEKKTQEIMKVYIDVMR